MASESDKLYTAALGMGIGSSQVLVKEERFSSADLVEEVLRRPEGHKEMPGTLEMLASGLKIIVASRGPVD